ncbi:MAG: hypothetical protein V4628_12000 [Pseudomonadota bacterium]
MITQQANVIGVQKSVRVFFEDTGGREKNANFVLVKKITLDDDIRSVAQLIIT